MAKPITTLKVRDEKDIQISSKIVWSEGCKPVRVVLRKIEPAKYVTHKECLAFDTEFGGFVHDSYFEGHYFEDFPAHDDAKVQRKAQEDWRERASKL